MNTWFDSRFKEYFAPWSKPAYKFEADIEKFYW